MTAAKAPPRVRLVHWNEGELPERARRLRAAGFRVEAGSFGPDTWKRLRDDPPAALVVDLSRLPSHGRQVAFAIRSAKRTRKLPLVFVGGEPDKVERIREAFPDATYADWRRIRGAVSRAIARPPAEPVVPVSPSGAYSGTPLVKKLGVRPGALVGLVGAPRGFEATLADLPEGAKVRRRTTGPPDLTLWFVRKRHEMERGIAAMADRAGGGGLWVVWPKQASGKAADLTQTDVRRIALARGLVDFKVCAVDATWSGLRFSRR